MAQGCFLEVCAARAAASCAKPWVGSHWTGALPSGGCRSCGKDAPAALGAQPHSCYFSREWAAPRPPQPGPGVCVSHPGTSTSEASSDSCPTQHPALAAQAFTPGSVCAWSASATPSSPGVTLSGRRRGQWTSAVRALTQGPGRTGCSRPGGFLCPFLGVQTPHVPGQGEGPSHIRMEDSIRGRAGWRCPTAQHQRAGRGVRHMHFHQEEKIFSPRDCVAT